MIGYERERADRFVRDALERVQSLPGVEAAALASRAPLDLSFSPQNVLVPGLHGPADRGTPVDTASVSADYFDALGVPLLQGRTFTTADTPDSPRVAIVRSPHPCNSPLGTVDSSTVTRRRTRQKDRASRRIEH